MKQNLNTHDIFVLVSELQTWVGFRVLNVYDINSKTICIKFNTSQSEKKYLLIESGYKFYTLNNFLAIKNTPSSFCSKLRKHLNNKRIESIIQVNLDRVIDLKFGSDEYSFHLIGEFYASGNIIFTDCNYKILTLLHPYIYKITNNDKVDMNKLLENKNYIENNKVYVGNIYPFELATTNVELTISNIKKIFDDNLPLINKKIKLKQFITQIPLVKYSPNVLEHAMKNILIDTSKKISFETKFEDIFQTEQIINDFISNITNLYEYDVNKFSGYKINNNIYPYVYSHIENINIINYPTFLELVSIYFQTLQPIETKELIKKKEIQIKLSKQEKVIWNIKEQIKLMDENIYSIEKQINILIENNSLIQYVFDQINLHNDINDEKIKLIEIQYFKNIIKFEIELNLFELNYSQTVFVGIEKMYDKLKKIKDKKLNAELILLMMNI